MWLRLLNYYIQFVNTKVTLADGNWYLFCLVKCIIQFYNAEWWHYHAPVKLVRICYITTRLIYSLHTPNAQCLLLVANFTPEEIYLVSSHHIPHIDITSQHFIPTYAYPLQYDLIFNKYISVLENYLFFFKSLKDCHIPDNWITFFSEICMLMTYSIILSHTGAVNCKFQGALLTIWIEFNPNKD